MTSSKSLEKRTAEHDGETDNEESAEEEGQEVEQEDGVSSSISSLLHWPTSGTDFGLETLQLLGMLLWGMAHWLEAAYAREGERAVQNPKSIDMAAFLAMCLALAYVLFRCIRCYRRCWQGVQRSRKGYVAALSTEESDEDDDDGEHAGRSTIGASSRFSDESDTSDREQLSLASGRRASNGRGSGRCLIDVDEEEDIAPPLDALDRRVTLPLAAVVSAEASPQPEPEPPTKSRAEPAPEDASTVTPKMEGSWRTFLEPDAEADRTAAGGDVEGSDSIFTRGGKGAVTEL